MESTETSSDPEGTDAVIIYWVFTADGEEIFYDEDGAEVTKEYVDSLDDVTWGEALTDSNGAILCSFVWNNSNVVTIDYGQSEEGYLPITVYDEQDVVRAEAITQCINIAFVVIYLAEIITVIVIYRKRRDA